MNAEGKCSETNPDEMCSDCRKGYEEQNEIALEGEGAQTVWVRKNEDGELEIDNLVFNKDEIAQLRNFLNENFGG